MLTRNASLWINERWELLPKGTWVEILNGKGMFTAARGKISYGPYDYNGLTTDAKDFNFPPMYNILVSSPYQPGPVDVNFLADHLRKLTPSEIQQEESRKGQ